MNWAAFLILLTANFGWAEEKNTRVVPVEQVFVSIDQAKVLVSSSEAPKSLKTTSLVPCLGVGGYEARTKTLFLTHLLHHSDQDEGLKNAREILKKLAEELKNKGLTFNDFKLVVAGASREPRSSIESHRNNRLGTDVLDLLKKDYGVRNEMVTDIGIGWFNRSIEIDGESGQMTVLRQRERLSAD